MSTPTIKPTVHPLLASLPDHLKDPATFDKVQRLIYETLHSDCGHNEVMEWAECPKCTKKMLQRRMLLRKLGFKNPAQYMAWRKVHEFIKTRVPLAKYNTK